MNPLQRALTIGLLRLGLGPGDIAWALGLQKSTVVLFLLREVQP